MNINRLLAMAGKEIIQIKRDARSIGIVIAMPLVMMLAFGYGVSFDTKHIPLYVYDMEGSRQSQDFLKRFQSSIYFRVVKSVTTYRELVQALDDGKCQMGIVVPADFSSRLSSGETVAIQALIDGTDSNSANLGMGYSQAIIQAYSQQVTTQWQQRQGHANVLPPISVDSRTWFNESLESMATIVPGVVALVMAVVGTFLTSLTIAREWERGTMEQLISTPVTPMEIMFGKLTPYMVVGLFDTCVCAAMGVWWFGVPFRGHVWVFFLSSILFLTVVLSMGYFFSVVAKTQLAASQISLIATFLPAFLLSGFIYPIDQMPAVIQVITHAVPARYYMAILRDVFLKGTPILLMWRDFAGLALFALLLAVVASRAFKKRLE
ncbi:MAG: ABC transporter permease [Desulfuromonadaceae bacterium]|nr:ABC transporter permease [Desulfuromonadaceae bacterium]MDD2848007.1 ABC transporter permease [Desulfuromonadaceae bacterium]MDD4131251.1 ABC transporter permease [Desulfuromonadaceae bacterium]